MNNPNSKKIEEIKGKNNVQIENSIGLDMDEQAMNGLYGMAETEVEDRLPHEESK